MSQFLNMNDIHPSVERLLKFPPIQQKTKEWFSYRSSRVTASEVSIVLAQGKGAQSLIRKKKLGGLSSFSTEYTRIGSDNEENIVKKYRELYPDVTVYHDLSIIPHKNLHYIAASLDAITNTGINVEIKTCFKDKHVKVCKAYRDQVQLQMEVADLEKTHLVQEYYNMPGRPIVVHEFVRDREWFERTRPIIRDFVDKLETFFPFDLLIIKFQLSRLQENYIQVRPVTSRFFKNNCNNSKCTFDMSKIKSSLLII